MALGGDPDDLRALATRLRTRADTLDGRAATMRNQLDAVHWSSNAARSYRRRLTEDAAAVTEVADRLHELAGDFDDLADTLEHRQRLVGLLVEAGIETAQEAAEAVADGLHDFADSAEDVLRDMGEKGKRLLEGLGDVVSAVVPGL
jgi:uncharacterized protein YukE